MLVLLLLLLLLLLQMLQMLQMLAGMRCSCSVIVARFEDVEPASDGIDSQHSLMFLCFQVVCLEPRYAWFASV